MKKEIEEEMVSLNCETCKHSYSKPKRWEEFISNIFFKWNMKYCDECRRKREKEALKKLPDVLNALIDNSK
jgi:TorA maturation chaperone TorD